MFDPASDRRLPARGNADTCAGFSGSPTSTMLPSRFSIDRYMFRSCGAETVSRMKWNVPASAFSASGSRVSTTASAPSRRASSSLPGEVVNCVTCAPNECANFKAMWPSPPRPTTPTFCPGCTFQCFIGE